MANDNPYSANGYNIPPPPQQQPNQPLADYHANVLQHEAQYGVKPEHSLVPANSPARAVDPNNLSATGIPPKSLLSGQELGKTAAPIMEPWQGSYGIAGPSSPAKSALTTPLTPPILPRVGNVGAVQPTAKAALTTPPVGAAPNPPPSADASFLQKAKYALLGPDASKHYEPAPYSFGSPIPPVQPVAAAQPSPAAPTYPVTAAPATPPVAPVATPAIPPVTPSIPPPAATNAKAALVANPNALNDQGQWPAPFQFNTAKAALVPSAPVGPEIRGQVGTQPGDKLPNVGGAEIPQGAYATDPKTGLIVASKLAAERSLTPNGAIEPATPFRNDLEIKPPTAREALARPKGSSPAQDAQNLATYKAGLAGQRELDRSMNARTPGEQGSLAREALATNRQDADRAATVTMNKDRADATTAIAAGKNEAIVKAAEARGQARPASAANQWQHVVDPKTGKASLYNKQTGEAKPIGTGDNEFDPAKSLTPELSKEYYASMAELNNLQAKKNPSPGGIFSQNDFKREGELQTRLDQIVNGATQQPAQAPAAASKPPATRAEAEKRLGRPLTQAEASHFNS